MTKSLRLSPSHPDLSSHESFCIAVPFLISCYQVRMALSKKHHIIVIKDDKDQVGPDVCDTMKCSRLSSSLVETGRPCEYSPLWLGTAILPLNGLLRRNLIAIAHHPNEGQPKM